MENPATTASNDPSDVSGSSRFHCRTSTRSSSLNRSRAYPSIAGDESTATTRSTHGRCSRTSAANLPSPQPRSSTERGESGSTDTSTSSPAARGATPPIRLRYWSTRSGSLHVPEFGLPVSGELLIPRYWPIDPVVSALARLTVAARRGGSPSDPGITMRRCHHPWR
jgi:hypothetical protein